MEPDPINSGGLLTLVTILIEHWQFGCAGGLPNPPCHEKASLIFVVRPPIGAQIGQTSVRLVTHRFFALSPTTPER
jgi:hypothetical protein